MSINRPYACVGILVFSCLLSFFILSSSVTHADNVIDTININVPVSCSLEGIGMNSHTTTLNPNNYDSHIGETTLKAFCNDINGFAIYAIGYTDDTDGKNVLASATVGSTYDIPTGTAISGNSQWAMKLATQTSPTPAYPIQIQNSFDAFHTVPTEYTLVAKRTAATDIGAAATGSVLTTTYQAYVSSTQPADTYTGKVKYVIVHPHDTPIPYSTMLDAGQVVAGKMKTLAANTETAYNAKTTDIKAIRMADSLPSGFVASDANTVSDPTLSRHPIYIFFDNTNDAGIMYFYSGGYQVVMNPDSSQMFRSNLALSDISGLETWDSSNVTTMHLMFLDDPTLTNFNSLARWNTSRLESMYAMFALNPSTINDGYYSQLSDISGLINWDTSNVENMYATFQDATSLSDITAVAFWDTSEVTDMGYLFVNTAITNLDALSNWNVSKVENMEMMFGIGSDLHDNFGIRSNLSDISGLTNWNTSSVEDISSMFQYADKITSIDALANWDVSDVTTMTNMFNHTTSLANASAIKGWDVRNVIATAGSSSSSTNKFYEMFNDSGATPEPFTLRAGTWDSSGTYVPSS